LFLKFSRWNIGICPNIQHPVLHSLGNVLWHPLTNIYQRVANNLWDIYKSVAPWTCQGARFFDISEELGIQNLKLRIIPVLKLYTLISYLYSIQPHHLQPSSISRDRLFNEDSSMVTCIITKFVFYFRYLFCQESRMYCIAWNSEKSNNLVATVFLKPSGFPS
jgi:hypothetical protein